MSIRIQSEVWEHSTMKGGSLLVLLALADNANNETHLAWPSVADLARRSRMSTRQVQNILRQLEDAGEIRCVEPGGMYGSQRRATLYRVFHPKDRGEIITPAKNSAPTGEVLTPQPMKPTSPQPSIEPSSKPSAEKLSKEALRRREGYDWLFGE